LAKVANEAQLHLEVTKRKEKKGAWAPFLLKVDDGTHLHPQATKKKKKERKRGSLTFHQDLAMVHPLPKATKKKKKRELAFVKS
jgi:hypothetical protein